jgi:hypothetical protein
MGSMFSGYKKDLIIPKMFNRIFFIPY